MRAQGQEEGETMDTHAAEVTMGVGETLEADRKLDVARPDNVLNLEVGELCVEAQLLDDSCVLPRCKLRVVLRLCAGDDHLTRSEDECRCLWLANTHDDGGKTLFRRKEHIA